MRRLRDKELRELRSRAPETCVHCKALVRVSYCRECRQYFTTGHLEGCLALLFSNDHSLHTTY